MEVLAGFVRARDTHSDINEHIPTLRSYAEKCSHVTECGVRTVVSSWAFAAGLLQQPGARLVQVDPFKSTEVEQFQQAAARMGLDTKFHEASDLDCPLEPTDMLFIDTWHVYGQMKRELQRWHPWVKKFISMHDTTVDEFFGETLRCGGNVEEQAASSGFPRAEIARGICPAIAEFLEEHPEWRVRERFTNNNGLTVLERTDAWLDPERI